jgi:2-oxoisovalerate dehydrogenase E1 component
VVHEDRVFASLGREIQGAVIEAMVGEPLATRVLGQDPVPGIPQSVRLEDRLVVSSDKVVDAVKGLHSVALRPAAAGSQGHEAATPPRPGILWTPNRNFVA